MAEPVPIEHMLAAIRAHRDLITGPQRANVLTWDDWYRKLQARGMSLQDADYATTVVVGLMQFSGVLEEKVDWDAAEARCVAYLLIYELNTLLGREL
jgi:hypothetical protein